MVLYLTALSKRKPFSSAGDFKSPGQGGPNSDGPVTTKKKRRGSSAASAQAAQQQSPALNDLVPPPLTGNNIGHKFSFSGCGVGYGDTIIASNPFDDTPPPHSVMSGPMSGPGSGGIMGGPPGMGPSPMMGHMNMGGMNGMNMAPMGNMANMNNMGAMTGPMGGMGQGRPMGPMGPACTVFSPNSGGPGPKPMPVSAGKIYPPDQPMVFNPQNPNAPPIYPCGICHKEVHDNDQAILCESGCNFWFHRICTGLTEAAYHLLTAEVYAEWVCDKCLQSKNIPLVKFKP